MRTVRSRERCCQVLASYDDMRLLLCVLLPVVVVAIFLVSIDMH